MDVQDFECKIASSQLRRYLNGEAFSKEALQSLEEHLRICDSCLMILQESQQVETAVTEVETPNLTEPAPSPTEIEEQAPKRVRRVLHTGESPWAAKVVGAIPGKFRTLGLSTGLAVVLIAMTTFAKDPTRVLGEKVGTPRTVASGVVERESPASKPTQTSPHLAIALEQKNQDRFIADAAKTEETPSGPKHEPAKEEVPTPEPKAPVATPKPKPAVSAPKPVARKTSSKRNTAKRTAPRPARTAKPAPQKPKSNGGIVIYDENGKRIN